MCKCKEDNQIQPVWIVDFGHRLGWRCGWGFKIGGSKDLTNGGSVGHLKEWR